MKVLALMRFTVLLVFTISPSSVFSRTTVRKACSQNRMAAFDERKSDYVGSLCKIFNDWIPIAVVFLGQVWRACIRED